MMNNEVQKELVSLLEYISEVATTIRMYSAYNRSCLNNPDFNSPEAVMWLSDTLHNLDSVAKAIDVDGDISHLEFLIGKWKHDAPGVDKYSSPVSGFTKSMDIQKGIKILERLHVVLQSNGCSKEEPKTINADVAKSSDIEVLNSEFQKRFGVSLVAFGQEILNEYDCGIVPGTHNYDEQKAVHLRKFVVQYIMSHRHDLYDVKGNDENVDTNALHEYWGGFNQILNGNFNMPLLFSECLTRSNQLVTEQFEEGFIVKKLIDNHLLTWPYTTAACPKWFWQRRTSWEKNSNENFYRLVGYLLGSERRISLAHTYLEERKSLVYPGFCKRLQQALKMGLCEWPMTVADDKLPLMLADVMRRKQEDVDHYLSILSKFDALELQHNN